MMRNSSTRNCDRDNFNQLITRHEMKRDAVSELISNLPALTEDQKKTVGDSMLELEKKSYQSMKSIFLIPLKPLLPRIFLKP